MSAHESAQIAETVRIEVGVRYCLRHEGIANEDDEVCDFARPHRAFTMVPRVIECDFRQLYYDGSGDG